MDHSGFAALAERHRRELHVHCYRMLASFDEAEDAVQETFLKAWRGRSGFDGGSQFRAWLYRIATNVCLDMLAAGNKRARPMDLTDSTPLARVALSPRPDNTWLEPMPDALKTDATKVRGCSASVWVYPTSDEGRLHFLADSNAAITKGVVALVLSAVQDKPAAEVAQMDVAAALAPFALAKHLSANRTQGVPNMIALVQQTAERYATAA